VNDVLAPHASASAGKAFGRLLSQETWISDLVALLASLDPQPVLSALDLSTQNLRISREERLRLGRKVVGIADLVVWDDSRPLALLEVKAEAAQHGDQYDRYDQWAQAQVPEVKCYLVSLEGRSRDAPDGWTTQLTLPVLLRSWHGSRHPHAGWLACSAADVLEEWVAQLDEVIGLATDPLVPHLAARWLAAELASVDRLTCAGLRTEAHRTSGGGKAMIVAWLPFPSEPRVHDAWLCVDLRSGNRTDQQVPWLLRLGVEAEAKNGRTTWQARAVAHELAMLMRSALTYSALHESLRRSGRDELAAAVCPRPGSHDGLYGQPDDSALVAWKARAMMTDKPGPHPALFHDNGLRLASQINVDVMKLDRHQLIQLLTAALDHLNQHARWQP
jgi:hypothetical protein